MTDSKTPPPPRRFFTLVEIAPSEGGRFAIKLDGRAARTPGARALALPTKALAALIRDEWSAQGDTLNWAAMPATRLAGLAIDGGEDARTRAVKTLVDYAASDLICYFAPAPQSLIARQEDVWGALQAWVQEVYGLAFHRAMGVMPKAQPDSTLERLSEILSQKDDFTLSGLAMAAPLFGSAIIALALAAKHLSPAAAVDAARLDEQFQEAQWGVDEENARRVESLKSEAQWLGRWFAALV